MVNKYVRCACTLLIMVLLMCLPCFAFADSDSGDTPIDSNEIIENTDVQVLRVSANQTSGLHSVLLSLIGDYNPIVKDYTYTSSNGYTSHSIDIQPDWSWIATCALFIVIIYCVFRLFGLALGGIR